jgi:hypothetical protein
MRTNLELGILYTGNRWRGAMDIVTAQSAVEVVERLGNSAIDYMNDRIHRIQQDGTGPDLDQADLLLNQVERILRQEA